MGWGTFVAGQVISSVRRSRYKADDTGLGEIFIALLTGVFWLKGRFERGYMRRVLKRCVLIHPEVEAAIDWGIWEEDITNRASKDWFVLLVISVILNLVWLFTVPFGLLFTIPFVWYWGKWSLARRYSHEINNSLLEAGYDVYRLEAELPSIMQGFLEEEALAEKELALQAEIQSREAAAEREKRKFGN